MWAEGCRWEIVVDFVSFLLFVFPQDDNGDAFDPQTTLLYTCNEMNHVKHEPEGFQTVEEPGEVGNASTGSSR